MVDGISVLTVVQGFGISDKDGSQTGIPHIQGLLEASIWVHGHVPKRTTNSVESTAWAAD